MEIPFGELVSETIELVDGQLREKQVEVRVEAEFPVVRVDRVRMVEVLQNLATNAIKFAERETHPIIEIGMHPKDGENIFFEKDNGQLLGQVVTPREVDKVLLAVADRTT